MVNGKPIQTSAYRLVSRANRVLVIKLMAAAVTYGFSILAARTMGQAGFGQVVVFLSAALFLSVLGARGQQIAALRFIPPSLIDNDIETAHGFAVWGLWRAATATGILFCATLITAVATKITGHMPGYSIATLTLGILLIPLVSWVDFQSHLARGFDLWNLSLIPKEILWRGSAGIVMFVLWVGTGLAELSANLVIGVLLATLTLIAIAQTIIMHRKTGIGFGVATPETNPDWQAASLPFWISSVSNIFLANADILIVGILLGPEPAGIYFAANRLAMLLSFFQTSHNVVLGPMLARSWQSEGHASTKTIIQNAAIRMTTPTLILGAVLGLFAPQALSMFGPEFVQAALPLRLLILAGIINAAMGPGDIALNMCGFHRAAMGANAWLLIVNAALLTLGAVQGGTLGVAVAVLVATFLRKLAFWALTWRHMSIRSDAMALQQTLQETTGRALLP